MADCSQNVSDSSGNMSESSAITTATDSTNLEPTVGAREFKDEKGDMVGPNSSTANKSSDLEKIVCTQELRQHEESEILDTDPNINSESVEAPTAKDETGEMLDTNPNKLTDSVEPTSKIVNYVSSEQTEESVGGESCPRNLGASNVRANADADLTNDVGNALEVYKEGQSIVRNVLVLDQEINSTVVGNGAVIEKDVKQIDRNFPVTEVTDKESKLIGFLEGPNGHESSRNDSSIKNSDASNVSESVCAIANTSVVEKGKDIADNLIHCDDDSAKNNFNSIDNVNARMKKQLETMNDNGTFKTEESGNFFERTLAGCEELMASPPCDGCTGPECPLLTDGCDKCLHLQKQLKEEQERCKILRANIHKVSANWFQRKSQLSESDFDTEIHPVALLNETTKIADDEDDQCDEIPSQGDVKSSGNSRELSKYVRIITQKSAQLDLAENQCRDLKKRMREYEQIIDDKDDIIHGLKDQLETYLNDNQTMSVQLHNLTILFQQLEKVDKEAVAPPEVEEDNSEPSTVPLPTQDEFQEMASSVSRTYIKLKDLIYEKKALVTEIERLNTLNVELQRRVLQQETRLLSVSDALHQTWLVVSDLKDQHTKLHDDEIIMRYELKQKREILTKLRIELESSRAQWQVIRQKNLESEQEYNSIRQMLQDRRKAADEGVTEESEGSNSKDADEKKDSDNNLCLHPDDTKSFDPPVDLLLEMGLEYGIIGEDAEMTKTVLKVIHGEDVRNNRLEQLEEHCSLLYQKLLASTSRSLSLASRLTRLHRHYGSDDEDDDFDFDAVEGDEHEEGPEGDEYQDEEDAEEQEDEHETQYLTDAHHMTVMESVLSNSPDSSEGYDTAYVSETDGAENLLLDHGMAQGDNPEALTSATSTGAGGGPSTASTSAGSMDVELQDAQGCSESSSLDLEENCDHLSRTLINFLPKKIEFLKKENIILQESLSAYKEECSTSDENAKKLEKEKKKLEEEMKILTKDMALETIQRKQLEEQLKHLGKCVDELKLKHTAEEKKQQQSEANNKSTNEQQQQENNNEDNTNNNSDEEEQQQEQSGEQEQGSSKRDKEQLEQEEQRLKKEVEMVKKDMELKKREKVIRKKEQELRAREESSMEPTGSIKNSSNSSNNNGTKNCNNGDNSSINSNSNISKSNTNNGDNSSSNSNSNISSSDSSSNSSNNNISSNNTSINNNINSSDNSSNTSSNTSICKSNMMCNNISDVGFAQLMLKTITSLVLQKLRDSAMVSHKRQHTENGTTNAPPEDPSLGSCGNQQQIYGNLPRNQLGIHVQPLILPCDLRKDIIPTKYRLSNAIPTKDCTSNGIPIKDSTSNGIPTKDSLANVIPTKSIDNSHNVLVLPIHMPVAGEQLILRVYPNQQVTLLILQISSRSTAPASPPPSRTSPLSSSLVSSTPSINSGTEVASESNIQPNEQGGILVAESGKESVENVAETSKNSDKNIAESRENLTRNVAESERNLIGNVAETGKNSPDNVTTEIGENLTKNAAETYQNSVENVSETTENLTKDVVDKTYQNSVENIAETRENLTKNSAKTYQNSTGNAADLPELPTNSTEDVASTSDSRAPGCSSEDMDSEESNVEEESSPAPDSSSYTVLVPTTKITRNASVTLQAILPTTFAVVINSLDKAGELSLSYTLTTTAPQQ